MLVCESDSCICDKPYILINAYQVVKYTEKCTVTRVAYRMVGEVTKYRLLFSSWKGCAWADEGIHYYRITTS